MATEKAASRRKWTSHEIVDGVTVPVGPSPVDPMAGKSVSDALQAAADAAAFPSAEEMAERIAEAITVTIRVEPLRVERIEQARALLGLAYGEPAELVPDGIQSFKDTDGRTMRVVLVDGSLFKQEVIR